MKKQEISAKDQIGGVLGFCATMFAFIVSFAFFMEFDPEGQVYQEQGRMETVRMVSLYGDHGIGEVLDVHGEPRNKQVKLYRLNRYRTLEVGDTLHGYVLPEKGTMLPESSVPQASRDWNGLPVVIFFWIVAIGVFWLDPKMLYVDLITVHHGTTGK